MRYAIAMIMVVAMVALAGLDMGLGASVVSEAQSDADYGWSGTVGSSLEFFSVDWGTRLLGTVYYPEHSLTDHPAITGTMLGTGLFMIDSEAGIELGGGIQYRNEYARTTEEDEYIPVFYTGFSFELNSGHSIKPFALLAIGAERKTAQAGFLITFGN